MSGEIQNLSQTCAQVAEDLLSQPDFFERHREDVPIREQSLPEPARYTGVRSADEQVNLRVGAMRLLGFSDRAIERECCVDRRTIPHRLEWLSRTGRIPAQKERLLRLVGESAEKSSIVLNALLDRAAAGEVSMDLAGMIRSVATAQGITVEKVQLLTGAPTEIVEQRVGAGRAEIEQFWRSAAIPIQAEVRPIDSESLASVAKPGFSECPNVCGHVPDTDGLPLSADLPKPACAGARPGAESERGAGGVAPGAGGENGNGFTGSQNLSQWAGSAPAELRTNT